MKQVKGQYLKVMKTQPVVAQQSASVKHEQGWKVQQK